MAPQYAPSLRARLPPVALLLQISFIVIFAFCVEIEDYKKVKDKAFVNTYANFQDIHVMVFMGFGFLATFLVRYGFSGSAFSMLVAAMAVQWATILNGFLLSRHHNWKIQLQMKSLVDAELCAASALVAMGAIHGRTNPVQLLLFSLMEVTGFVLNKWFINSVFQKQTNQLYGITLLHIFGAVFGVMSSWVLYRSKMEPHHEKAKFSRKSGLFAMLGTLFLWMFWPSFNSALVRKFSVVCGTYLSLAVSTVTAMAVSALSSRNGKINPVHIQSSMLAGGVAVGAITTWAHVPWIAMTVGFCATILSTLGVRYLKVHMQFAFECYDTCGVLSVHAIPAILGWFTQLFIQLASSYNITIAVWFAVNHICVLLITVTMSLVMGIITGFLIKWSFWKSQQDRKCYDDQAFWEFPHLAVRK
ncbi:rh blood group, D antigen [Trichomycterus rosablanca]|uniref:rh blood group, D antigen n=1 Tax=Trichomycterus rosablanca TaxID=2290929 RepID=UPI002F358F3A